MRRATKITGVLLAVVLGHVAQGHSERTGAQETSSSARSSRFLAHANPLLEHMVNDLAVRCSLSDVEQQQLIGALRPAAVQASFQGNAWEEEEGLVRPRHLLRSKAVWKAMSTVLSSAEVADYRRTVHAHFDHADRAIIAMWISWLDEAVGLSGEQRKAFAELLSGNTEGDSWSLTPFEALCLSDEWMRLVAARTQQAISRMSPEQQRDGQPLFSPRQRELFILQITEEERRTDIREHGYPDTKGENIEGRREIAQAAVAMHMELLGPLEPMARDRLAQVAEQFVEHHLDSEDGICRQADLGRHVRFKEAVRGVLSESACAAYEKAQKQRQANAEDALRDLLVSCLKDHLFLLDETHRRRMREASSNILLPAEHEMQNLPSYLASVLKSLPEESCDAWQQQQIDLLGRHLGAGWGEE